MSDPNPMSEAEMEAAIETHILKQERDPQLRIAEALEEIAIQLQRFNEGQVKIISAEEADDMVTEAAKKHGLPLP